MSKVLHSYTGISNISILSRSVSGSAEEVRTERRAFPLLDRGWSLD